MRASDAALLVVHRHCGDVSDVSMVLANDKKDLDVADEDDQPRRERIDDIVEGSKADIRRTVADKSGYVQVWVKSPTHSTQIRAEQNDDLGYPHRSDDDVPQSVCQHRRVGQRSEDDVTFQGRHCGEVPHGDADGDVHDVAEKEGHQIWNYHRG